MRSSTSWRAWAAARESGEAGASTPSCRQTRPHRDLDLAIDATAEAAALHALAQRGYVVQTDWRPVRVEVAVTGNRWVDVHPVVFDQAGDGVQADRDGEVFTYPAACFVTGTSPAGRSAACRVEQQVAFDSGYEPREVDRADLALLHALQQR